jgi:quercetin dioxygenase-like cupin family protein
MSLQHFLRVHEALDIQPLLDEIDGEMRVWDLVTGRQDKIEVQRETRSVPLRGLRKSKQGERLARDVHESRWTTASERFPRCCRLLRVFALEQGASLGRARIVNLPAGSRVYPHTDRGEYYALRDRYHLVLRSRLGSWLKAGDEEVRMREGELWWFDNKAVHEAHNDGPEDRLHLIFDLLPASARSVATALAPAAVGEP